MAWQYYTSAYRWRPYTRLVDPLLTLGAQADTAGMRRVASDSSSVRQVVGIPPPALERLRQSLRLRRAARKGDTVVVDYAIGRDGCDQVRLLHKDARWLVAQARSKPC